MSSQPSEQALRWGSAVPRKRTCPECGLILSDRDGSCALGCGDESHIVRGSE